MHIDNVFHDKNIIVVEGDYFTMMLLAVIIFLALMLLEGYLAAWYLFRPE